MIDEPSISNWVQKQTVLLTGGTGFLGQALLCKLLRLGCPKIYLLIRPKKNQGASERLDQLLESEIFEKLQGLSLKRIVIPVKFNSSVPGLSIADKDRELLLNEVTTVFHEAASVKFDDELNKAILTNVRVTRDLLLLSRQMKHLQIFHYVSTAYSNFQPGVLNHIEEKVYAPVIDWRKAIKAAETVPTHIMNYFEKKLLGGFPNTYTFTKHLSESLVRDFEVYYPVVISRPTVVYPAWKEPYPGWLANLNSPAALILGIGKGVLRVLYMGRDTKVSYIQVDYVTDLTVVTTWFKAVNDGSNLAAVYNCQSFTLTAREYEYYLDVTDSLRKTPLKNVLWHPFAISVPNCYIFWLGHILLHFLPGLIVDVVLKCIGHEFRLSRIYRKMYLASTLLYPFQVYEPSFSTDSTEEVIRNVPKADKNLFCFALPKDREDWSLQYTRDIIAGSKKLLNEPPEASPADIAHVKRLYYIHVVFTSTLALLALWYFPYSWLLQTVALLITVVFDVNKVQLDY